MPGVWSESARVEKLGTNLGKRIAVKLIEDRPYLVAYKPHQTQARLIFVGRAHDMLHWRFQDGPRELILQDHVIEWIEEGRE